MSAEEPQETSRATYAHRGAEGGGAVQPPVNQSAQAAPVTAEEQRIQEDIPWGVRIAAAWSWRVLMILAFTAVIVWLLGFLSMIIISVMVAALLSVLLRPLHNVFLKLKFPRVLAAITTIIAFLGFIFGLLYLVGQEIVQGFSEMADQVQAGLIQLIEMADETAQNFGIEISAEEFNAWLNEAQQFVQDNSDAILGGAMSIGSTAGNILVGFILALFTLIFFLADGRRIWDFSTNFVPRKFRPAIHGSGRKGWKALGSYVRVQVFVAGVDAVGIGIGAWLLGVPLAFPVAVLVFLGSFIPIIGAVVTGAIAVLLALVANGLVNALLMLGVVLLVQQIESNVLQPVVMGKAVQLHPLAVVLAVTAGTTLLGIVGALFAVPVLAFVNRATQYIAKEEWRHDEEALEMERLQTEEAERRAVEREQAELEQNLSISGMKRRIKETVPGLDPDRPTFRRGESENQGSSRQGDEQEETSEDDVRRGDKNREQGDETR